MTWHVQKHWSEAEEAYAAELWAGGFSAARVAEAVNARFGSAHTRNAVIGLKSRRRWPQHGTNSPKPGRPRAPKLTPPRLALPREVRVPETLPILLGETPDSRPVSFEAMGPGVCRWPLDGALYCGAPASGVYCAEHARAAHTKPKGAFHGPRFRPSGLRFR